MLSSYSTQYTQTDAPVSGPQGQSLQVQMQPLAPGGLQGPGAGSVLGGVGARVGGGGEDPPHRGVLHGPPAEGFGKTHSIRLTSDPYVHVEVGIN